MKLETDPRLPVANNYTILRGRLFDLFPKIAREINRFLDGYLFTATSPTGDYTVTEGDSLIMWVGTANGTVTLPDAKETKGKRFTVKNLTGYALTVATAAGTIDGAATQVINVQYTSLCFVSDGTNYWIV